MKKSIIIMAVVAASVFVLITGSSQASQVLPISGNMWVVTSYGFSPNNDLSLATFSALGPAAASFSVSAINFNGNLPNGQEESYDAWLSNGGLNTYAWANAVSAVFGTGNFVTGPEGGTPDYATLIQFTGYAYFPQIFSITKDDGFDLYLNGQLINPGGANDTSLPTSPETVTFNLANYGLAAGMYKFTLDYAGWNGFPEVLQSTGFRAVPIPPTAYLFASGLIPFIRLRKKRLIAS